MSSGNLALNKSTSNSLNIPIGDENNNSNNNFTNPSLRITMSSNVSSIMKTTHEETASVNSLINNLNTGRDSDAKKLVYSKKMSKESPMSTEKKATFRPIYPCNSADLFEDSRDNREIESILMKSNKPNYSPKRLNELHFEHMNNKVINLIMTSSSTTTSMSSDDTKSSSNEDNDDTDNDDESNEVNFDDDDDSGEENHKHCKTDNVLHVHDHNKSKIQNAFEQRVNQKVNQSHCSLSSSSSTVSFNKTLVEQMQSNSGEKKPLTDTMNLLLTSKEKNELFKSAILLTTNKYDRIEEWKSFINSNINELKSNLEQISANRLQSDRTLIANANEILKTLKEIIDSLLSENESNASKPLQNLLKISSGSKILNTNETSKSIKSVNMNTNKGSSSKIKAKIEIKSPKTSQKHHQKPMDSNKTATTEANAKDISTISASTLKERNIFKALPESQHHEKYTDCEKKCEKCCARVENLQQVLHERESQIESLKSQLVESRLQRSNFSKENKVVNRDELRRILQDFKKYQQNYHYEVERNKEIFEKQNFEISDLKAQIAGLKAARLA